MSKSFSIGHIKSAKNVLEICPKFKEYMITHGSSNGRSAFRTSPMSFQLPPIRLPKVLDIAVARYLREEVPTIPKTLKRRGSLLSQDLWLRNILLEKNLETFIYKDEKAKIMKKWEALSDGDYDSFNDEVESLAYKNAAETSMSMNKNDLIKSVRYRTENSSDTIQYSTNLATLYMISRLAPNFAICCQIFYEIRKRCPLFQPESFFDFGSGVGSATWAANSVWTEGSLQQHIMVDYSTNFLKIAEYLMKDGNVKQDHISAIPNVYYRAYLTSQTSEELDEEENCTNQYDLVVSAFSLFDITGGYLNRRKILDNLWKKTNKNGGFLVLVELGNKDGFRAILEARDWLKEKDGAQIFSPCPHSFECPKADFGCYFYTRYQKLRLTETHSDVARQKYSYIVIGKGNISKYQELAVEKDLKEYPRVVTYSSNNWSVQDICKDDGSADRYYFPLSSKGPTKQVLKSCAPGDFLPMTNVKKQLSSGEFLAEEKEIAIDDSITDVNE